MYDRLTRYTEMREKANTEKGINKPMRIKEVAHCTWPECYNLRFILKQEGRDLYSAT